MKPSRREFLRNTGVLLASLALASCQPQTTCYAAVTSEPTPAKGSQGDDWASVRAQWVGLKQLAQDAPKGELGQKTLESLIANHRAALDKLAQAGQLDSAVAQDMQAAFEAAAHHIWMLNSGVTCYKPSPGPVYGSQSSDELAQQAQALIEMSQRSSLDPAVVAQAQAAIERDIAFLAMSDEEEQAFIDAVLQAGQAAQAYPQWPELEMDIPPESAEAARLLARLLVEQK